ncbi:MAG: glycosyltransferase family 2 protein [Candidatus Margulisiibacteriota bacterium]
MNCPLISIVIVNHNSKSYLTECFASLKKQTFEDYEVIFIDNGSTDGSTEYIKSNFSDFTRLIRLQNNCGFAEANNIGIRTARGKYVVLLNNDTKADPFWLQELIRAAEKDEQIGMCASKILFMREPTMIDSTGMGIYPDGTSKQRGWKELDRGQYDNHLDILLPSGCAALYRREMLDQIGLFDERFFAYCEDTDLGLRARLAGWKCRFVPKAIVYHLYAGSWRLYPLRKIFLIERNRTLLVWKMFPFWTIMKSYYYYLIRCVYHICGIIYHRGEVSEYLTNIPLWSLILTVIRAQVEAIILLPSYLLGRIKTNRSLVKKTNIYSLLKKYAISAQEITLKG